MAAKATKAANGDRSASIQPYPTLIPVRNMRVKLSELVANLDKLETFRLNLGKIERLYGGVRYINIEYKSEQGWIPVIFNARVVTSADPVYTRGNFNGAKLTFNVPVELSDDSTPAQIARVYQGLSLIASKLLAQASLNNPVVANAVARSINPLNVLPHMLQRERTSAQDGISRQIDPFIMRVLIPYEKTRSGDIDPSSKPRIPIHELPPLAEQMIAICPTYDRINAAIPRGSTVICHFDFSTIVISKQGVNLRAEAKAIGIVERTQLSETEREAAMILDYDE